MGQFNFSARLHFSELTGVSASNLEDLVKGLKAVDASSIYHHTHRFLQQHIAESPQAPNDFAYWVSNVLGDEELGENLASIDIMQFTKIDELRLAIVAVIENYLKDNPRASQRFCAKERDFYFIKAVSFIVPAGNTARDLTEFLNIIENISIESLYFHMFEARLRLGRKTNDFAIWAQEFCQDDSLSRALASIDPYTHTINGLRKTVSSLIKKHLKGACHDRDR